VLYAQLMKDFVTPADLARELEISQRRVRNYLRERHGKLVRPDTRWQLEAARANDVLSHFRAQR